MQLPLSGWWQLSPLTDLTIPQVDIEFPARLSSVLPSDMSEADIAKQEWHLMHDIEVDQNMLDLAAIDLVIDDISGYAEVRVNGIAIFDCDGSQSRYQKSILDYLHLGKNRFEILFLELEQDWLIDEAEYSTVAVSATTSQIELGMAKAPFLKLMRYVRLKKVLAEQIWHHCGGCELKVDVYYQTIKPGLVSGRVHYGGVSYTLPLDVRNDHIAAIFQLDAPKLDGKTTALNVDLEGFHVQFDIELTGQDNTQIFTLYKG